MHTLTKTRRNRITIRRAFTLVEMLVTISIISLLVALLMPGIAHARLAARNTMCASNLKQLAILHFDQAWEEDSWALSVYDLHFDRWKAVSSDPIGGIDGGSGGLETPPENVRGFGRKLFRAETTAPNQPPHWKIPCPEAIDDNEGSYGVNFIMPGRKPEHILPREVIFVCAPYRVVARGRDLNPERHNGRLNFLMGDTHIKSDDVETLPEDDKTRRAWRPDAEPIEYADR